MTSTPGTISPRKNTAVAKSAKENVEKTPAVTPAPATPAAPQAATAASEAPGTSEQKPPEEESVQPMRPPRPGTSAPFTPVAYKKPTTNEDGSPVPPPLPRRRRKTAPRYQRVARISSRRARRGTIRLHARYTPAQVALFYLAFPAAASLVIAGFFFLTPPARLLSDSSVPLPPEKLARKLFSETSSLMTQKKYDAAWKNLQKLQELQPDNAGVYLMEGAIQASWKNYDQARAAFHKARSLAPTSFAPAFNLAEMEFTAGNYAEAENQYRELRKTFAPSKLVIFRIYLCAVMQKHREDAVALMKSPGIDSQSMEWFYMQAIEAQLAGRKGEARETLETARMLFGAEAEPYDQTLKRLGLIK